MSAFRKSRSGCSATASTRASAESRRGVPRGLHLSSQMLDTGIRGSFGDTGLVSYEHDLDSRSERAPARKSDLLEFAGLPVERLWQVQGASASGHEALDQRAVAPERYETIGFPSHVFATVCAHRLEDRGARRTRPARPLRADRGRSGRDSDATACFFDESRRLAVKVGCRDHWPASGEDSIDTARHDKSGEAAGEADVMNRAAPE